MNIRTPEQRLLGWLQDAYAMEREAATLLKTMAGRLEHYPELRARIQAHVSETHDQAAPSVSQLGSPTVQTPGVPVYDYLTGQSVLVTTLSGANPDLAADRRDVFKVGLTVKPWSSENFTLTASYVDQRTDDPIGGFPAATAGI